MADVNIPMPKKLLQSFKSVKIAYGKKSSMGPIMRAVTWQFFKQSPPPTAATNWGFKVKLWMISLSVMQQVMETAMSRLKLTAAENTWRWSGSNGLPGRTAELLLSLLCGRKLRRFLNGEYGRDGWRDKVKEHGMDGEEQEMNMQWLRSLSS